MNVYLILFFWTALMWWISKIIHSIYAKKIFVLATLFPAIIIMAVRAPDVGSDTGMYNRLFYELQGESVAFFSDSSTMLPIENSFILIANFLGLFTNDSQAIIAFYAFFSMLIWIWIFYYKSENIYMSTLFFMGMFYCEGFNSIRQCLSTVLVYAAFMLRFDKQTTKSFVILALSYFIHHSSIIFFPLFFLYPLNTKKCLLSVFSVFAITFIVYFSGIDLLSFFISEKYAEYFYNVYSEPKPLGAGIIKIFIFILVGIWGIYLCNRIKICNMCKDKQVIQFFCLFLLIASCSTLLQYRIGIFYRLIYSFSIGLCILIPLYAKYSSFNKYYLYIPTILFIAFYLFFTLSKNPELNYSMW